MYLTAYLAQGSTAVLVGSIATATTLDTAVFAALPVITALCLAITGFVRVFR